MTSQPSNAIHQGSGILICGMPQSATTWIFNVVTVLLRNPEAWQRLWIQPGDDEAYLNTNNSVICKCHHFNPALMVRSQVILYSLRDVRTAAVSYQRKFGACSSGVVGGWIDNGEHWRAASHCTIKYEDVVSEPQTQIQIIEQILKQRLGESVLRKISVEQVLQEVGARFEYRQGSQAGDFDAHTMILPGHRTFQPSPEALSVEQKKLYDSMGETFKPWLDANGYGAEDLGQATDYHIAQAALEACSTSVVVDVGAEKGSFTALAKATGATEVHIYEPLPRHIMHLRARFAGDSGIVIHDLAVSDHSGQAKFHIATDRNGRELDYHHTLSDEVGDSHEVICSEKTILVNIVSLSDEVAAGHLPSQIGMLKIDTDGHDLAVLHGLGALRPEVIMAEFWDDLPLTSGKNPYRLADIVIWARNQGYGHHLVIRRRERLENIGVDESWSASGDWGNVVFFNDVVWHRFWEKNANLISERTFTILQGQISGLANECEAKEAEIRHLAAALDTARAVPTIAQATDNTCELTARARLIERLDADLQAANADRIAQAIAIADANAHRQSAVRQSAAVAEQAAAAIAQLTALESATAQSATELEVRARLITQLDAQLREANADRIAQASAIADANAHRQSAERQSAVAAEQAEIAIAQLAALESATAQSATELEVRARLITQLDAQLREANADRITRGEVIGGFQARLAELERQAGNAASLATRLPEVEGLAQESVVALRAAKDRLMALQTERTALQEQAAEMAAVAQGADRRAEAAERECAARQVVIDELVRARDAFAAALGGRRCPQPWYERLMARMRGRP